MPFRWSLEFCDACQQEGPATIEHILEVCYLCSIAVVSKRRIGKIARCDFCRQHIKQPSGRRGIPLEEWQCRDGVGVLAAKLGLPPSASPFAMTEARMHSLLSAVERASAVDRHQLSPFGLLVGGVLGIAGAIPLALWLQANQLVLPQIDQVGFQILTVFMGIVVGIIVGPIVEYFLRRSPGAYAKLARAHKCYGIDLDCLKEASQGFSQRTRKAVLRLYKKVHLRDG